LQASTLAAYQAAVRRQRVCLRLSPHHRLFDYFALVGYDGFHTGKGDETRVSEADAVTDLEFKPVVRGGTDRVFTA
jgi:hypothetical protein